METNEWAFRSSDVRDPMIWASCGHSGNTSIFDGEATIDMRYVCRGEDARATGQVSLLEEVDSKARVRRIERGYLAGAGSGLAAQENDGRADRNVARLLFLEGDWVQKRPFDVGWSDESRGRACHKEEGTEKHRLHFCREWHHTGGFQNAFRKWEQKGENLKGVELAKRFCHASSR